MNIKLLEPTNNSRKAQRRKCIVIRYGWATRIEMWLRWRSATRLVEMRRCVLGGCNSMQVRWLWLEVTTRIWSKKRSTVAVENCSMLARLNRSDPADQRREEAAARGKKNRRIGRMEAWVHRSKTWNPELSICRFKITTARSWTTGNHINPPQFQWRAQQMQKFKIQASSKLMSNRLRRYRILRSWIPTFTQTSNWTPWAVLRTWIQQRRSSISSRIYTTAPTESSLMWKILLLPTVTFQNSWKVQLMVETLATTKTCKT